MSFLSVFKKIGSVLLSVEHVAAPVLELALPGAAPAIAFADSWVTKLQGAIVQAEAAYPAKGTGAQKSAAVVQDFYTGMDLTNQFLEGIGKKAVFDPTKLQAVIDAQVAAYNNFADMKATMTVADIPKAPA